MQEQPGSHGGEGHLVSLKIRHIYMAQTKPRAYEQSLVFKPDQHTTHLPLKLLLNGEWFGRTLYHLGKSLTPPTPQRGMNTPAHPKQRRPRAVARRICIGAGQGWVGSAGASHSLPERRTEDSLMVPAEGVCGSLVHSNSHRREVTNISSMEDSRL